MAGFIGAEPVAVQAGRAGRRNQRAQAGARRPVGPVRGGHAAHELAAGEFGAGQGRPVGEEAGVALGPAVDDRPDLPTGAIGVQGEDASFGDEAARILPAALVVARDGGHDLADFIGGERHGRHEEPATSVSLQFLGEEAIVGFAFDLQPEFPSGDVAGEDREARDAVDLEDERTVADEQRSEQREYRQRQQREQGPPAGAMATEAREALQGDGVEQAHADLSNRMRGSTAATQRSETMLPMSIARLESVRRPRKTGKLRCVRAS